VCVLYGCMRRSLSRFERSPGEFQAIIKLLDLCVHCTMSVELYCCVVGNGAICSISGGANRILFWWTEFEMTFCGRTCCVCIRTY
jgi:hypothetical protein